MALGLAAPDIIYQDHMPPPGVIVAIDYEREYLGDRVPIFTPHKCARKRITDRRWK